VTLSRIIVRRVKGKSIFFCPSKGQYLLHCSYSYWFAQNICGPLFIYIYMCVCVHTHTHTHTVKPALNGPFIKRNFVSNGNIFRSRVYHSIQWLNGNMASAEKCSGRLRFRLRQVLLLLFFFHDRLTSLPWRCKRQFHPKRLHHIKRR
jgi:hypothetical protein